MKKLIITLAIAALALPLGFAQTTKTKTKSAAKTEQTAAVSSKPVRHVVTLASLDAPTRDAITKAVGAGKVTKLVSVTTNGTVSYQATVVTGKKKSMMKFDASGNPAA
jgi:hypothetical protein